VPDLTKQKQEKNKHTIPKGKRVPRYKTEDVSLGLKGARLCHKEGKHSKSKWKRKEDGIKIEK
jgi:hypothetical protein